MSRLKGNILITGGSGFIGSRIVEALSRENERKVFVYDINAQDGEKRNVVTIQGDVFNSDRLSKVMRDKEISDIIHMVGLPSIPACAKNPEASFELNVSSMNSVLDCMRRSEANSIVFSSTAVVYGIPQHTQISENIEPKPTTIYGCHKLAAESLVKGYCNVYGFKAAILRLFNVYGDLDSEQGVVSRFVKRALKNEPIIIEGGDQLRDFVHLNDVVRAFVKSLNGVNAWSKVINIGSGMGLSIKEVAGLVAQYFPKLEVTYAPPRKMEYSLYADVQRMKDLLSVGPINPRNGISHFVKECVRTRQV